MLAWPVCQKAPLGRPDTQAPKFYLPTLPRTAALLAFEESSPLEPPLPRRAASSRPRAAWPACQSRGPEPVSFSPDLATVMCPVKSQVMIKGSGKGIQALRTSSPLTILVDPSKSEPSPT